MNHEHILFLTVGTGDKEKLEESLFSPIRKSMRDGVFTRYVLFPSWVTGRNASALCGEEEFRGRVECRKLPQKDAENNADACFAFFDRTIRAFREQYPGAEMTVDLTRGTKAMSAAVYAAGTRNGIVNYRYVYGERDAQGRAVAGTEIVGKFDAGYCLYLSRLDQARELFRYGQFAAVEHFLPLDAAPEALRPAVKHIRFLGRVYNAWDRLDYPAAAAELAQPPAEPENGWFGFKDFRLKADTSDWVRRLAEFRDDETVRDWRKNVPEAVAVAYDMWGNGRRRCRQRQFEDAIVRAYRLLEMIAQIGLFRQGYNGEHIPAADAKVKEFLKRQQQKKTRAPKCRKDEYVFDRELAIFFLDFLENKQGIAENQRLGKQLRALLDKKDYDFRIRNRSILIHGFVRQNTKAEKELLKVFDDLEKILQHLAPAADREKFRRNARFLDFVQ